MKVQREAEIVEALALIGGPAAVAGIARELYSIPAAAKVPPSTVAKVTQSLRVLERDGIVVRAKHANRTVDWRLAREG